MRERTVGSGSPRSGVRGGIEEKQDLSLDFQREWERGDRKYPESFETRRRAQTRVGLKPIYNYVFR